MLNSEERFRFPVALTILAVLMLGCGGGGSYIEHTGRADSSPCTTRPVSSSSTASPPSSPPTTSAPTTGSWRSSNYSDNAAFVDAMFGYWSPGGSFSDKLSFATFCDRIGPGGSGTLTKHTTPSYTLRVTNTGGKWKPKYKKREEYVYEVTIESDKTSTNGGAAHSDTPADYRGDEDGITIYNKAGSSILMSGKELPEGERWVLVPKFDGNARGTAIFKDSGKTIGHIWIDKSMVGQVFVIREDGIHRVR